jgi:hypothetical protein
MHGNEDASMTSATGTRTDPAHPALARVVLQLHTTAAAHAAPQGELEPARCSGSIDAAIARLARRVTTVVPRA